MIYGYCRVSTGGQSVTAQVEALAKAGAAKVLKECFAAADTPLTSMGTHSLSDVVAPQDIFTLPNQSY